MHSRIKHQKPERKKNRTTFKKNAPESTSGERYPYLLR